MKKKDHSSDTPPSNESSGNYDTTTKIRNLYKTCFLDYASYVILERAIPRIEDGLKPVQRRILYAIKQMDDGRFNKVANVIGQTMQYHPHGDAAISDAMTNLGQKEFLLETQGNWGDVRTGDRAAASRYIEARLSKLALEVAYNAQTTEWQLSYDGRKNEPVTLPIKFPLLLTQGVEGIAVGLSTKIMPHNFCELLTASIAVLKGKNPTLFPDFPTGGYADCTEYKQGKRGGKVRVRAKIEVQDKKTLILHELPYGTTTGSLIDSIIKANDKGKIKIRHVADNTAKDVEILIHIQPGQDPERVIDALYAFTECELSISPNACVIAEGKPRFMSVQDILRYNTKQTLALLKKELEIKRDELMEKILFSSLEQIFIEKRIYRDIETCETFDRVITAIDKGLEQYKKQFYREILKEDIIKLTEIKIKRISKYDSFKAHELLKTLQRDLKETRRHLRSMTEYTMAYFQNLLNTYGSGRKRKTVLKNFQAVTANEVIANSQKLYLNRTDGFLGWSLKKDEYICECSEIDDVLAIRKNGTAMVCRVAEKIFMGKDILYAGIWKKGDERMVYNMVYLDGKTGISFIKRCTIPAVIRDREYHLTQGNPYSKITYLSANSDGEAESIKVKLTANSKARKKYFEFDFATLDIKGRGSKGNILTRHPVRKVEWMQAGTSTLGSIDVWFDPSTGRFNKDKRGHYAGKFEGNDIILSVSYSGCYRLTHFDINARFEPEEKTVLVEQFNPKKVLTAIYRESKSKTYFVKRFYIETQTLNKDFYFIPTSAGNRLEYISSFPKPEVELAIIKGKRKERTTNKINLLKTVAVKGWKAMGNQLSPYKITSIRSLQKPSAPDDVSSLEHEEHIAHSNPQKKDDKTLLHRSKHTASGQRKNTVEKIKKPKTSSIGNNDKVEKDGKKFRAGDTIDLDF